MLNSARTWLIDACWRASVAPSSADLQWPVRHSNKPSTYLAACCKVRRTLQQGTGQQRAVWVRLQPHSELAA